MNKIQFFYDEDLIALEQKINDWLAQNEHIHIEFSSMQSIGKPSQRAGLVYTEKHVFYILYSTNGLAVAKEQQEHQGQLTDNPAEVKINHITPPPPPGEHNPATGIVS